MGTTKSNFLTLVKRIGPGFASEDAFNSTLIKVLPDFLNAKEHLFEAEAVTTNEPGKASARADIVLWSNAARQALVVFELKLDRNVTAFSTYEQAEKQLTNYAQDLRALYGVLISETHCQIYKYTYSYSKTHPKHISSLPSITEIEKELAKQGELLIEKTVSDKLADKSKAIDAKLGEVAQNIGQIRDISQKYTALAGKSREIDAKLGEVTQHIGKIKQEKSSVGSWIVIGAIVAAATIWLLTNTNTSIECPVKGNVNPDGKKTYHLKGDPFYDKIRIKPKEGDACFATEKAAIDAGFNRASLYTPAPVAVSTPQFTPKPAPQKVITVDCPIKGNVNEKGQKYYHLRGSPFYDKVKIVEAEGDRCFNTEQEALAAGFTKPWERPQANPTQKPQPVAVATTSGCYIKGNVNSAGKKYYHLPGDSHYNLVKIKPEEGDACFNTPEEAEKAGFIRAGSWVKK